MPDAPTPLDMQFMRALKARRGKKVDEARELLESILAEDPDHGDSLEVLAMLLSESGDQDRAIELTERLVALRPDSLMGHANMSRFWMLKGDKETAEEWQAKARVLGWKEEIARKGGDPSKAGGLGGGVDPDVVEKQEAKVADSPDDVLARLALAGSYRKLGMPAKAVGHLRHALSLDEENAPVYLELGMALEEANVADEAIAVYERGIPLAEANGAYMPRNRMQTQLKALKKKRRAADD